MASSLKFGSFIPLSKIHCMLKLYAFNMAPGPPLDLIMVQVHVTSQDWETYSSILTHQLLQIHFSLSNLWLLNLIWLFNCYKKGMLTGFGVRWQIVHQQQVASVWSSIPYQITLRVRFSSHSDDVISNYVCVPFQKVLCQWGRWPLWGRIIDIEWSTP